MGKMKQKGVKRSALRVRTKRTSDGSQSPESRGKAWTFPKNQLEDAIRVARAIEEKNAGNPM